jgi:hypothetical protein
VNAFDTGSFTSVLAQHQRNGRRYAAGQLVVIALGVALESVADVVSLANGTPIRILPEIISISFIPGEVFGIIHFCGWTLQVSIRRRTAKNFDLAGALCAM